MEQSRYNKDEIKLLPINPGIYRFYAKNNDLIYVGKAKNIKKRVQSYFTKQKNISLKTAKMVSQIQDIEFTIVNSEYEALLLESTIIKNNSPKYNILLRDDKTYPYICIINERFPRIMAIRKMNKSTGEYFGPYSDLSTMNSILDLIKDTFTIRTCKFNLSKPNIENKKIKVCLEYHIKNCKGPCEGLQSQKDYDNDITQIRNILKGNFQEVRKMLNKKMLQYAQNLNFEKAQQIKEKIIAIDKYYAKSLIISPIHTKDIDVFAITTDSIDVNRKFCTLNDKIVQNSILDKPDFTDKNAEIIPYINKISTSKISNNDNNVPNCFNKIFISYLKIHKGVIVFTKNIEIARKLDESVEEIFTLAIVHLRSEYSSNAKEVISNMNFEKINHLRLKGNKNPKFDIKKDINIIFPKKGDKRKLLELAIKNVLNAKKDTIEKKRMQENKSWPMLKQLEIDLGLSTIPRHIECFDNSNMGGSNPVAAMICFKDGHPYKKGYRHYNIKTVEGPNDYASMEEIIERRYDYQRSSRSRNLDFPDLILIDGGKGQLNSAVKTLKKLNLYDKVEIRSIAKKLEEIYKPNDQFPLHLCKTSNSLKFVQKVRDEAHRFAINFHKLQRSKNAFKSELDDIKGIGLKTATILLKHFGSVKKIKKASSQELVDIIGSHKSKIILKYFKI